MKNINLKTKLAAAMAVGLLSLSAAAQGNESKGSDPQRKDPAVRTPQTKKDDPARFGLARVRAMFKKADVDSSAGISAQEAERNKIPAADFARHDTDRNRQWNQGEFVMYVRELLNKSGRNLPKDLANEVARITAKRRAKASAAKRPVTRKGAPDPSKRIPANNAGGDPSRAAERKAQAAPREQGGNAQREAGGAVLARAQKHLKGLVDAGSLTPQEARGFYEILRLRAKNSLEDTGQDPADNQGGERAVPELKVLRARIRASQQRLGKLVQAGSLSSDAARDIHQAMVDRAQAALGADQPLFDNKNRPKDAEGLGTAHKDGVPSVGDAPEAARARKAREAEGQLKRGADGAPEDPQSLRGNYQEAERALRERAANGEVTREEYEAALKTLQERAKKANGAGAGKGSGAENAGPDKKRKQIGGRAERTDKARDAGGPGAGDGKQPDRKRADGQKRKKLGGNAKRTDAAKAAGGSADGKGAGDKPKRNKERVDKPADKRTGGGQKGSDAKPRKRDDGKGNRP